MKNVLPGAINKYKAWAEKEKGAAFVKDIDVTFAADDPIKNSCVQRCCVGRRTMRLRDPTFGWRFPLRIALSPAPLLTRTPLVPYQPSSPACLSPDCRCGGVILATKGDAIIIDNTLETRLELAMELRLPDTRKVLFGGK